VVDAVRMPHPAVGGAFESPVPPGRGWPDDPATSDTPVAKTPAAVRRLAKGAASVAELSAAMSVCRACPRLVQWRESVALTKRASFAHEPYWGRPAPGWGASAPKILIVGLAPAANGANRTGRVFTGDSSGDWLFASLHRVGLAELATSRAAGDGQQLSECRIVAAVRCAPPQNKPQPDERSACAPWLEREIQMCLESVRAVVALGAHGWAASLRALAVLGFDISSPKPKFGHAAEVALSDGRSVVTLLGSYHPSQHNTFTGRLTPSMMDAVFARARELGR
jgi:uracil-DNA glycosylase